MKPEYWNAFSWLQKVAGSRCCLPALGRWGSLTSLSNEVCVHALISSCTRSIPGWDKKGSGSLNPSIWLSIVVVVLMPRLLCHSNKSKRPGEAVHKSHGSIIWQHSTMGRGWTFGSVQFLFRHLMKYFQECSPQMLPENFTNTKGRLQGKPYPTAWECCHPSQVLCPIFAWKDRGGRKQVSSILSYFRHTVDFIAEFVPTQASLFSSD